MATLIAVYKQGKCIGRCDAKCYAGKHPHCDCICGGANHGVGLKQASDNTQEMVESWIDDYRKDHEFDNWKAFPKPVQMELGI
jgi:hypothetical protein